MSTGSKSNGQVASESTSLANPITYYKNVVGKYPSNSQVWWSMKRPPELGSDKPPKLYLEVFDPSLRYQVGTGNTPVARGHFTVEAFNIDRAHVSGVNGIESQTSNGARPSAIAFYAGRVFYAGTYTSGYNTSVYFSPVLERPDQVGQCYQIEDPTAEDLRDLLPNDGGVIVIPDVARVYNLVAYGPSLFVFANNGVWQIGGSGGTGFRADDYAVTKLSGCQTISNMSFVLVEGQPFWWNLSGIYTISPNQTGQLQVSSITDTTIKTLYDSIPDENKLYVKGAYDLRTKTIQWIYRSTDAETDADKFVYDKILTYDTRTGSFSPWEGAETGAVVFKGIFDLTGSVVQTESESVFVDNVQVTVSSVNVETDIQKSQLIESKIKYIVHVTDTE